MDVGGAPRPNGWELRRSKRPKGHGLQPKWKLGVDTKQKEVKRSLKGVQLGSRLVSQCAL